MRIWLALAGTLAFLLHAAGDAAAQTPPARAALTVVADDNYPPYVFRSPDGAIDGYLVELWKLWEGKTGVKVDFVATDWAKAKAAMAAGKADVIDTIISTPERRQSLDFTAPYADIPVSIYVHDDIGGIIGKDSLRGFMVAAKGGGSCIQQLQAAGVTGIMQFDSYQAIVDAAVADKVRIFCMHEPPANYLLTKAGAFQRFHAAFSVYTGQFHRAVKKGDAATLALVQRGFDAIGRSEAAALREKWMGAPRGSLAWGRPLAYGLAAALLATTIVVGWGVALRRTVGRRTAELQEAQRRLQRLNRLHRVLNGVGDTIAVTRERQTLFDAACRVVVVEGRLLMAWIGAPDATGRLRAQASAGTGQDYPDEVRISVSDDEYGRGPAGVAFREGRTVTTADITRDPATRPSHDAARRRNFLSVAAFPIKVRGEPSAVVCLYSDQVSYFDADECELLERMVGQIGIALDAADADAARSRAEAELRASEQRFSTVFRTSPVGMTLGRAIDGRFLDVNEAWLRLFGYQKHELVGHSGLDIGLWCDIGQRKRFFDACQVIGHVENFDATMRRRDGDTLEIAFAAAQIDVGGEPHLLASYVDISLRRQAEQAREQQAEELERLVAQRTGELNSIFQALPDLYFRLAGDGTMLDFRAGLDSDLYVPPEQFLGKRVQDVLPPDSGAIFAHALQSLRENPEPITVEYALQLRAGETHFEARMLPFRGGEVIAVVRNISERKTFEQGREKARGEIERLSQLRSEFLANMSHEIRTPLNGIMGLAQIGRTAQDLSRAEEAFSRIVDLSRQLLRIVDDVLDFSKIDANRLEIESVALDPCVLAEEAAALVRDAAREKGLSLSVQCAPDLPARCMADPLRLQQILTNLMTNAIKFTERGDVQLWVGRDDDLLVMRVSDTGIGISDAQLQQLFVPFRQADSSTTRRFGGTGLGLSISRRLAQLMGGEIDARSEPGHGSVFELRLPLLPADTGTTVAEQAGQWSAMQRRLQGLRLLVAEDNPVNQIIIEAALKTEGAVVAIAGDGQQAVDRVRSDGAAGFDLVLMDLQMPVMDGYAATSEIRQCAPGLPIVGQTAHAMPEERDRCLAAGMVAHLTKPIDLELLVSTVQQHARRRER